MAPQCEVMLVSSAGQRSSFAEERQAVELLDDKTGQLISGHKSASRNCTTQTISISKYKCDSSSESTMSPSAGLVTAPSLSLDERLTLSQFRQWVFRSPEFVNARTDERFLLRFLYARNFNLDEATAMMSKYFRVRDTYPHAYRNLDIDDPAIMDLMSRGYMFPLRSRDADGRFIVFARSAMFGSCYGHRPTDLFRSMMITFEALLEVDYRNQQNGFVYIFDSEGVTLSEVSHVGVWEMQRLAVSGERAVPMKHKVIHWLNLPPLILGCYNFVSSFVSEKLRKRLKVHNGLESLYKCVPRAFLPDEYGGEGGTVQELADEWIATLQSLRERLVGLDAMRYDKSAAKSHAKKHHSRKGSVKGGDNDSIGSDGSDESESVASDHSDASSDGGGNFITRTWRRTLGKTLSFS